jgi:hypothetical protein
VRVQVGVVFLVTPAMEVRVHVPVRCGELADDEIIGFTVREGSLRGRLGQRWTRGGRGIGEGKVGRRRREAVASLRKKKCKQEKEVHEAEEESGPGPAQHARYERCAACPHDAALSGVNELIQSMKTRM